MGKQRVINGDVTRNLTVNDEDLIVHGSIASGVRVVVRGGRMKVDGNVGDRASIIQRDDTTNISTSGDNSHVIIGNQRDDSNVSTNISTSGDNSPVIIGGSNVTINGKKITDNGRPVQGGTAGLSGIDVKGSVGNHVVLDSGNSLHAANVGHDSTINARNNVNVGNVGANTQVTAGDSIEAGRVDNYATLEAGDGIDAKCVGPGVSIKAGNGEKALPRCR